MTETARVLIEISHGLIPGQATETSRWVITSREWYAAENPYELLAEMLADAHAVVEGLADPQRNNWVRLDWVWL